MDIETKIRLEYEPRRASELAYQHAIGRVDALLARLNETRSKVVQGLTAASAGAQVLRGVADSVGIDLSDQSFPDLRVRTEREAAAVLEEIGFVNQGKPLEKGVVATGNRAPLRPEVLDGAASEEPNGEDIKVEEPKKRLVPTRISKVTDRAREAMARVAKPTPGDTSRSDAMKDETGRAIPVDEQIVIDDQPPEPGEGDREEGDKPIREKSLD